MTGWEDKWGAGFDEFAVMSLVGEYSNSNNKDKFIARLEKEMGEISTSDKEVNAVIKKALDKLANEVGEDSLAKYLEAFVKQKEDNREHDSDKDKDKDKDKDNGEDKDEDKDRTKTEEDVDKCPPGYKYDKESGECIKGGDDKDDDGAEENRADITGAPNPEDDTAPKTEAPDEDEKTTDPQAHCVEERVNEGHTLADAKKLCGERKDKQVPEDAPIPKAGKEAAPTEPHLSKEIKGYRKALKMEILAFDKDICEGVLDKLDAPGLVALRNSLGRVSEKRPGIRKSFSSLSTEKDGKKLNEMLGLQKGLKVVVEKK